MSESEAFRLGFWLGVSFVAGAVFAALLMT